MSIEVTRRAALKSAAILGTASLLGCETNPPPAGPDGGSDAGADAALPSDGGTDGGRPRPDAGPPPTGAFQHGVASGDPFSESVILWTRISERTASTDVTWEIASDVAFTDVVAMGTFTTDAARDFTVKLEATGLTPATTYYYRFTVGAETSPLGRTRTAPTGATPRLRFAVCSCSNFAYGYFHGYRRVAERADLDAVIHLGDYIYEYGSGEYGSERECEPAHEILTLDDYRTRYRQYRGDHDLQEAHRQHPFIATWDDHESADNSWSGGAENHQPDEGPWETRRAAAAQAYREWMPFREQSGGQLYRSLGYGDLAELIVLDTRIVGRDEQATGADDATLASDSRQLLGAAQEAFLFERLDGTTARWKVICQQVMMAQFGFVLNTDQWDGYPAQRRRVLDHLETGAIDDVVVLTGDIHSSWGHDLTIDPMTGYDPATGAGSLAVELVTPAITSPSFGDAVDRTIRSLLPTRAPHTKFFDGLSRGYILLDLDATRAQAAWFHLADVSDYTAAGGVETEAAVWSTATGANHLTEDAAAAAPVASPPALAP